MVSVRRALTLFLLIPLIAVAGSAIEPAKAPDAKKTKPAHVPRSHSVALGGVRKVAYSREGDPAGAHPGEAELEVRPLVIDGRVKDWTTGERHDVTESTFVVRSAQRINDALPQDRDTDKSDHWAWQRGPWLLVDRISGHAEPLKLPDFSPGVSEVAWFRDYAAYCGVPASSKHLYAVVAQLAVRKPLLAKKLGPWNTAAPHPEAACAPSGWQREPLQVTFQPAGLPPTVFDLTAGPPDSEGAASTAPTTGSLSAKPQQTPATQ
jgi:hypothetical protein